MNDKQFRVIRHRRGAVLCLAAMPAALLTACLSQDRSQKHVLPNGYIGAVVVAFGQPGGIALEPGSGPIELHIPENGMLRVADPGPLREYSMEFFYSNRNGPGEKLLTFGTRDAVKIFGISIGGYYESDVAWVSYLVGVPRAREDWIALRNSKVEETVIKPEPFQIPVSADSP